VGFRLLKQWLKLRNGLLLARFAGLGRDCPVNDSHFEAGGRAEEQHIYVMRGRGLRANVRLLAVLGTAAVTVGYGATASADTLEWALVQAYQNNPSLNAQRAALRAVDENVPQALSGYRPKLSVTAAGGYNYFREVNKSVNQQTFPNTVIYSSVGESLGTRQFGATATETLSTDFKPPIARGKRKAR